MLIWNFYHLPYDLRSQRKVMNFLVDPDLDVCISVVQQFVVEGDSKLWIVCWDSNPLLAAATSTGRRRTIDSWRLQVSLHALVKDLIGQVRKLLDEKTQRSLPHLVGGRDVLVLHSIEPAVALNDGLGNVSATGFQNKLWIATIPLANWPRHPKAR